MRNLIWYSYFSHLNTDLLHSTYSRFVLFFVNVCVSMKSGSICFQTKFLLCMSQWKSFWFWGWLWFCLTLQENIPVILVPKIQVSNVFCIDKLSLISHTEADNAISVSVEISGSIMSDQCSAAGFCQVAGLCASLILLMSLLADTENNPSVSQVTTFRMLYPGIQA